MNEQSQTPMEYRFKTFQELVERVPTDKIELCMSEMGIAFAQAKFSAEMGGTLGILSTAPPIIRLPEELGWIDDGKCIVTTHLKTGTSEEPFLTITCDHTKK